jgi:hypothetical protein
MAFADDVRYLAQRHTNRNKPLTNGRNNSGYLPLSNRLTWPSFPVAATERTSRIRLVAMKGGESGRRVLALAFVTASLVPLAALPALDTASSAKHSSLPCSVHLLPHEGLAADDLVGVGFIQIRTRRNPLAAPIRQIAGAGLPLAKSEANPVPKTVG